ncbi:MAG: BatA domain-containing protein [Gemmatimonadales bacterium]
MARAASRSTLMGFLAPLWLGALAAVALPILLHLRAAAPPERVQVGSIADLTAGLSTRSRRRLSDLLLLALRLLFVIVLALLLAQPVLVDHRPGRLVAVVPAGMERVRDSLLAASVAVADVNASIRDPWHIALLAEPQLNQNDTMLLVAPDGTDRYFGWRPTLTHAVRILAAADPVPSGTPPLRIRILTGQAKFEPQRDSVAAMLNRLPPTLLQVAPDEDSSAKTLLVGRDQTLGLDSASLAAGALSRDGAIDSLLTRLLRPSDAAPPISQRAPRHLAALAGDTPSRDLRSICWWLLIALFAIERLVASRRP